MLRVDVAKHLVVSQYSGRLSLSDVLHQWKAIREHPAFDPSYGYLADLSEVSEFNISAEEIRDLWRIRDPFDGNSVRIVVAPTDLLFGMMRMYEMSGGHSTRVRVVRTRQEAHQLLDV